MSIDTVAVQVKEALAERMRMAFGRETFTREDFAQSLRDARAAIDALKPKKTVVNENDGVITIDLVEPK